MSARPYLEIAGKPGNGAEIACRIHFDNWDRANAFLCKLVEMIKGELRNENCQRSHEPNATTVAALQAAERGEFEDGQKEDGK